MSPGAASGNRCFIPASFQSHLMNVISIRTTNFLLRRWGRPSRRPWALHKTLRAWWRKMMTSPWCRHAHRCRRVLKGSDDHRRKTERTLRTGWCTAVWCAGALVRLLGRDVAYRMMHGCVLCWRTRSFAGQRRCVQDDARLCVVLVHSFVCWAETWVVVEAGVFALMQAHAWAVFALMQAHAWTDGRWCKLKVVWLVGTSGEVCLF